MCIRDRNYKAWTAEIKNSLKKDPEAWSKLLEDVPGRPSASCKGGNAADDMLGLIAKFNWQYKRPTPNEFALVDTWAKSRQALTPEHLQFFIYSRNFDIDQDEFRHTHMWAEKEVDWNAWHSNAGGDAALGAWTGSSMLVPASLPSRSAVGERKYYERSVTTICFPAFCFLLRAHFTAVQISDAWLKLPLVMKGKKNRGSNGSGKKRWY